MTNSKYPVIILMLMTLPGFFACSPDKPDNTNPPPNIELNTRLIELNIRLADLSEQLVQSKQQTRDANETILNLNQRIKQLEKKEQIQPDLSGLQQQIDLAQNEQKMVEQQLQDYLEKEKNNLKLLADKEKQLQQSATRLVESQQEKDTVQSEMNNFRQQLEETRALMQSLLGEQQQLDDKLENSEQALLLARTKANDINLKYRNMLTEKNRLESVDDQTRKQLGDLRQNLEATQKKIARLTQSRGIYTVQSDDNLSKIAAFFYRDGTQWTNIWKANQFLLDKPDLIYTGMVLVIPHTDQTF